MGTEFEESKQKLEKNIYAKTASIRAYQAEGASIK